jgi:esterase FrsA
VNDVAELKQYAEVHARSHRIPRYRELLERIHTDDGEAPGSWAGEWIRAGEALERQGRDLEAGRHYAMARFPYADGPARKRAHELCIRATERWRTGHPEVEPLEVQLPEGRVRCWVSGLSATEPKPLLVVMGGIVTVKEQWAPKLVEAKRLGMAALVTEMPGVGENTLPYRPDSWRMLSGLLDAVADRADTDRTYAVALSFSGHLALRCAVQDRRIRGVVTGGAPIGEFFTDVAWQRRIPRITADTLAHMIGIPTEQLAGGIADWALTPEQLAELDVPVCYGASLRDEIIPPGEVKLLREWVHDLDLVENDDVHGSPRHVAEMQLWTARSLLHTRGVHNLQTGVLGLLLRAQRARRRLVGTRS